MEKYVRVLVMFDMPTTTKKDRKNYATFRKSLIKEGYIMMQFSVYTRVCKGVASAKQHLKRLNLFVPKKGNVRALLLTEKQFDGMIIIIGEQTYQEKANKPRQLTLFDELDW